MKAERFRAIALAAIGAGALVVSSCGGGGGGSKAVDAEDWVADVCDLALDFEDRGDDIFGNLDDVEFDDRDAKDRIVSTFEEIRDAQDELIDEFDKLGYPDVDDGEEIRDAFKDNLDETRSQMDQLIGDLEDLDEDELEDGFFELLFDIEDPDLREAIEDVGGDGADEIIELIEEDADCAEVLFDNQADGEDEETDDGSDEEDEEPVVSTVPVEDWTEGLCNALSSWQSDIEAISADIDLGDGEDVEQVKDGLVIFFEDATFRTQLFKDDVDNLGTPDTDDGEAIQAALSGAAGDVERIFAEGLEEVRALDTSDPDALAAELTDLGERLEAAGTEVADTFAAIDADYDTSEINAAAENVPGCEGLF